MSKGACGADRELAGRFQPRRQEVAFELVAEQLVAGRHDRSKEGGGPQGRPRGRAQELT
jgi:hypothetical protein